MQHSDPAINGVLGLVHSLPRDIASSIGIQADRGHTVDNLQQIICILENMQSSPGTFYNNKPAVAQEVRRIGSLIEEIKDENVVNHSIDVITYGGRGFIYRTQWSLVGHNTGMTITPEGGNQSCAFCESGGAEHYRCMISMQGWDGSVPGGRAMDPYSRPSTGWF